MKAFRYWTKKELEEAIRKQHKKRNEYIIANYYCRYERIGGTKTLKEILEEK